MHRSDIFCLSLFFCLQAGNVHYPTLQCPPTIYEDADMMDDQGREYKHVTYELAQAYDSSGDPVQISFHYSPDYSSGDIYYVGVTTVTVTITGSNNIMATCSFTIYVVSDCKYGFSSYCHMSFIGISFDCLNLVSKNIQYF